MVMYVCARCRCHFLNIPSRFNAEVVVQLPLNDHLDVVPSYEEVQVAVGHLKSHKAEGESCGGVC